MYRRSHVRPLVLIHLYCMCEVLERMAVRFSKRLALVDDRNDRFLTVAARLGGYCTVEQAQAMGLAKSPSQTLGQLKGLERSGFLRRVVGYPLVYQVTKSVTRMIGFDMSARRPHVIDTMRCRLAAVSFYLDAIRWPAKFIFRHEDKIAAFAKLGCPRQLLPRRGGQPYLWEEFIVRTPDSGLSVVIVDRPHWTAFLQLLGFLRRFASCRSRVAERVSLVVAVASESRRSLYEQAARHNRVLEACGRHCSPAEIYRISTPVPYIRSLSHEPEPTLNDDSRRP